MPAAHEMIANGGGLALMDSIRSAVAEIQARERSFLTTRTDAARRSAAVISVAVPIGFGIALLGPGFSFTVCRKVNRELSERVDQRTGELQSSLTSRRGEITERHDAEAYLRASECDLRKPRDGLERRVVERTAELERSNHTSAKRLGGTAGSRRDGADELARVGPGVRFARDFHPPL